MKLNRYTLLLSIVMVTIAIGVWYTSRHPSVVTLPPGRVQQVTHRLKPMLGMVRGAFDVSPTSSPSSALVTRVVDGDTVVLQSGQHVRYIGMDTPEIHHPTKGVQCYGQIAADKNRELVEGHVVRLVRDVSETDRYGRLLRYVYIDTPQGEVFVNEYLVRMGYAHALTYPPDVKYNARMQQAQTEAQLNNRGLWSSCPL